MRTNLPNWLGGKTALLVGDGAGLDAVAGGLESAGATTLRAPYVGSIEDAETATEHVSVDVPTPISILLHGCVSPAPGNLDHNTWRTEMNACLDSRFFLLKCLCSQTYRRG